MKPAREAWRRALATTRGVAGVAVVIAAAAVGAASSAGCSGGGVRGASGGNGDDGGAEASTPTAGQACVDFAKSVCTRIQACQPFLFGAVYGDTEVCISRTSLPCQPQLGAPGSQATASQVEACAVALAAQSCGDLLDNAQPDACDLRGTLARGAACATGAQCATGYCKLVPGTACGTCEARLGTGAACVVDGDCGPGVICTGGTCLDPGGAGAPCDGAGLACARTLTCIAKHCQPPLPAGATCTDVTDCDGNAGLYCNAKSGKCTQTLTVGVGSSCGAVGNDLVACQAGAACIQGTCVAPAADDAACDVSAGPFCRVGAECAREVCTVPDPGACR
jgi:hypothetical protein